MSRHIETWGVVLHHASPAAEAQAAWQRVRAHLASHAPGLLLHALGDELEGVRAHAASAPSGARFVIAPLLVAPGLHFRGDVATVADAVTVRRPDLQVERRPALLDSPAFLEEWLARLNLPAR